MKINDAWIDEPNLFGKLEKNRLCIEVTQLPDNSIPMQEFDNGLQAGKFGPFVKYRGLKDDAGAGKYNVKFAGILQPVVDVSLFLPDRDLSVEGFSLPISRARQIIRKNCGNGYRLTLSAHDAEHNAETLWEPQPVAPNCRYWFSATRRLCGNGPVRILRISGVETYYCAKHMQIHNEAFASRRKSSK